jgi:hypothetical protein
MCSSFYQVYITLCSVKVVFKHKVDIFTDTCNALHWVFNLRVFMKNDLTRVFLGHCRPVPQPVRRGTLVCRYKVSGMQRHTGMPPQGFRFAANFYKKLYIRTL